MSHARMFFSCYTRLYGFGCKCIWHVYRFIIVTRLKLSADSYCYLISPLFVKEVGSITKKIEDERDSEKLEFLSTFTNIMPL
jgi:hypothetical protein